MAALSSLMEVLNMESMHLIENSESGLSRLNKKSMDSGSETSDESDRTSEEPETDTESSASDSESDLNFHTEKDKHVFIEDVIIHNLNKQARHFTGTGTTPMKYPLRPIIEEILETAELIMICVLNKFVIVSRRPLITVLRTIMLLIERGLVLCAIKKVGLAKMIMLWSFWAKITAVDGHYQIGIYAVRPIEYGEEITFDYNSITDVCLELVRVKKNNMKRQFAYVGARYVMRCVFGDPKKAPPPLERLSPEAAISFLWKGKGSLVDELLRCMAPHMDDGMLNDLRSKIRSHDPSSASDDIQKELRKSLIWLRDEVRNLPCTYKCRHDAADLIHIYAHTKCFFRVREYKAVNFLYISPLDLGPKYTDK
ncbi:hypothetical protein Vadar_017827 [Vaccinium darrowii]|uniref:Uncharacterized protein n=1 Tax=Vaccinium darrowii TaxID=229202 RepID=A0ACB7YGD2_9ERIC|nr:hypothetical protein Vadar_017827 [Vaccinium darrowii]